MKKIVLLALGLCLLVSGVPAYQVFISAPETLTIGMPLVVNGTTTFGIGTPIDVVLYQQVTTSTEVKRKIAYVQADNTFRVIFDTTYLPTGTYKVEVPTVGTGDSVNMRQVRLIDRSDEIVLSSQTTQVLSRKLSVTGKITGDINSGVQVAVIGPDNGVIFGPSYVTTDNLGGFSVEVPVSQTGDYEMTFTDSHGYIGSRVITIISGKDTLVPVTSVTGSAIMSARTKASRDNPAYFIVRPLNNGTVTVTTSSSVDWVVEYADANGVLHTVNDQGEINAEEITIDSAQGPLYFKIYPYKYSVSTTVSLNAANVESVALSPTMPEVFRPVPEENVPGTGPAEPPEGTPSQKSPLGPIVAVCAAGSAMAVFCLRRS
jgi:hypothetical protein